MRDVRAGLCSVQILDLKDLSYSKGQIREEKNSLDSIPDPDKIQSIFLALKKNSLKSNGLMGRKIKLDIYVDQQWK